MGRLFDDRPDVRTARSVLFVCLGNICRSPLARAVFEHEARSRGVLGALRVDSCGTGDWHIGGPADPRTIAVAGLYGVPIRHVARQLAPARDFADFDVVVAMDRANLRALRAAGCPTGKAFLFLAFADPARAEPGDQHDLDTREVPDPYSGGEREFERVYRLVRVASMGLLDAMFASGGAAERD